MSFPAPSSGASSAPTPISAASSTRSTPRSIPALFHQGMLNRAREAGATIIPRCPAINIRREGAGFLVETPKGTVAAANVVIATNGYTGRMTPWLQRRVIPIGSYIIATEPLPRDVMARLMPKDRIVSDTRKVVYYYRASPDGRRILFGGRVSTERDRSAQERAAAPCRAGAALPGARRHADQPFLVRLHRLHVRRAGACRAA